MLIEFDKTKRAKTLQERGLDFADAGRISSGLQVINVDGRRDYNDVRYVTFARLTERMVVVVWTPRCAARRIISMRYANERETIKHSDALG